MKRISIAAALLAAGAMVAPAFAQDTTPAPPPPAPVTPPAAPAAPAGPAAIAAGMGRLYISYPTQEHGDFSSQLAIDDAWQSSAVAPGTCIYFDLPPGSHGVHTLVDPKLNIDVTAGASVYVELHVRHTFAGGKAQDDTYPKVLSAIDSTSACQLAPSQQ